MVQNNNLNKLVVNFLIKIDFYKNVNSINSHSKINSLFFGKYKNFYLYNVNKMIWALRYFFFNLINFFNKRLNLLLVNNTNSKLFDNLLKLFLESKENNLMLKYINIIGFLDKSWYNGLISNWKIIYNLISKLFFYKQNNLKKKEISLKKILDGIKFRNINTVIPDSVLFLDKHEKALEESLSLNIPAIGFIDNTINPKYFLYYNINNLNSKHSLFFLLNIIELSIIKSIYNDQKLLKILILKKINDYLK